MYSCVRPAVIVGVILHFVLSNFSSYAIASDAQYNRASLRGLQGLYVSVEGLSPEIEKDGLTEDLIRRDVESKLRMAGIRPLSKEEWFDVMGSPHLNVNVNALILRETKEYIFYSLNLSTKRLSSERTYSGTGGYDLVSRRYHWDNAWSGQDSCFSQGPSGRIHQGLFIRKPEEIKKSGTLCLLLIPLCGKQSGYWPNVFRGSEAMVERNRSR